MHNTQLHFITQVVSLRMLHVRSLTSHCPTGHHWQSLGWGWGWGKPLVHLCHLNDPVLDWDRSTCLRTRVGGWGHSLVHGKGVLHSDTKVSQNVSCIHSDKILHSLCIPVHLACPTPNSLHAMRTATHHTPHRENVAVKNGEACVGV